MRQNSEYRSIAWNTMGKDNNWLMASVGILIMSIVMEAPLNLYQIYAQVISDTQSHLYSPLLLIPVFAGLPLVLLWFVFVSEPFKLVYVSSHLHMLRTQRYDLNDMFQTFKPHFSSLNKWISATWKILLPDLIILAWVIGPVILAVILFFISIASSSFSHFLSIILGTLAFASYAAIFVISIIKGITYSMVPFLMLDNPDMPAMELANKSKAITQGHKGQIFMLTLSFIGWFILGILTCCIGLLPVTAYFYTTMAAYYEDLKSETRAQEQYNNAENTESSSYTQY